jgi:hypothetical protein
LEVTIRTTYHRGSIWLSGASSDGKPGSDLTGGKVERKKLWKQGSAYFLPHFYFIFVNYITSCANSIGGNFILYKMNRSNYDNESEFLYMTNCESGGSNLPEVIIITYINGNDIQV